MIYGFLEQTYLCILNLISLFNKASLNKTNVLWHPYKKFIFYGFSQKSALKFYTKVFLYAPIHLLCCKYVHLLHRSEWQVENMYLQIRYILENLLILVFMLHKKLLGASCKWACYQRNIWVFVSEMFICLYLRCITHYTNSYVSFRIHQFENLRSMSHFGTHINGNTQVQKQYMYVDSKYICVIKELYS